MIVVPGLNDDRRTSSAARWVTKQPYLGSLCFLRAERGLEKVTLIWSVSFISRWRTRILQNSDENLSPEKKTELIAKELSIYNVDIAAISETHLNEPRELCEQLGIYILLEGVTTYRKSN